MLKAEPVPVLLFQYIEESEHIRVRVASEHLAKHAFCATEDVEPIVNDRDPHDYYLDVSSSVQLHPLLVRQQFHLHDVIRGE
jgi:predicted RNA-binding protein associated with RNAse of E/G family